jgi:hypothetical protein
MIRDDCARQIQSMRDMCDAMMAKQKDRYEMEIKTLKEK